MRDLKRHFLDTARWSQSLGWLTAGALLTTAAHAETNQAAASQPDTRSEAPMSATTKPGKVTTDHGWTPPKTPLPGTEAEVGIFGPVIERIVEPCASPGFPALDLDTGKIVTSGEAMPETSDMESPAMEAWRQKTGADIVVVPIPNEMWQIRHFLQRIQVRSRYWDEAELSPQQVRNWLLASSSRSGVMSFSHTPDPATFLFQTRSGIAGIMQLLEISDQPRGVKIRYKLAQSGTTESQSSITSSNQPSAGQPPAFLGHPLGAYLAIEGVRAESGKVGVRTLLVDTVNGKKLDRPVGVWIENVAALPKDRRCILRGYESGKMIGTPPAKIQAAKEAGREIKLPQAGWQFFHYFVVISVDEPQDLKIK